MSDELKKAEERIKQLENSMFRQNLTEGTITKIPWRGGLNSTAVFKVKRII